MSAAGRKAVVLSTTLEPEYHAGLAFLVEREDLTRGAANAVLCRLLREELDRKHPGIWDRIRDAAKELPDGMTPREESLALTTALRSRST